MGGLLLFLDVKMKGTFISPDSQFDGVLIMSTNKIGAEKW